MSGTLPTFGEDTAASKGKTPAMVADEASHSVGPVRVPEQQRGLSDTNEIPSQIGSAKYQGKKRKKRVSIGQYSRKRPKLAIAKEAQETVTQPLIEAPESDNHGQVAVTEPQHGEVKDEHQSPAPATVFEALHPDLALEQLSQERVSENGGQNLSTSSLKTPIGKKPKRKKRKAIGQQKPRRKATAVVTKGVQPVLTPAATPKLADAKVSSVVKKARSKGRSNEKLPALTGHVRIVPTRGKDGPRARLARGRMPRQRLPSAEIGIQEEGNEDRNEGDLGGVDSVTSKSSGRPDRDDAHENIKGAKRVVIKSNRKLKLHPESKASKAPVSAKRSSAVKTGNGGSSSILPAAEDNVQDLPTTGKDKPSMRIIQGKEPKGRLSSIGGETREEEGLGGVVDRAASEKRGRLNQEDDDESGDEEARRVKRVATKKRGRLNKVDEDEDEDEDEDDNDEEFGAVGRIATKRRAKPYQARNNNDGEVGSVNRRATKKGDQSQIPSSSKALKTSNSAKTQKPRPRTVPRKPPDNTIPITVYRMSSNHDLDPNTDDLDPLIDLSRFPKSNSINAVDVLAQVCREQVSKTYDSVNEAARKNSASSQKVALDRKLRTIKMYGDELDLQLFHLVSHPRTLTKRTSMPKQPR